MSDEYAIIRDGVVINRIKYDGVSDYAVDEGATLEPCDESVLIGYFYKDGIFSSPPSVKISPEEMILLNSAEREFRIEQAKAKIMVPQTKLLLGRAVSDTEKDYLNKWIDYIDKVQSLDVTESMEWPSIPE